MSLLFIGSESTKFYAVEHIRLLFFCVSNTRARVSVRAGAGELASESFGEKVRRTTNIKLCVCVSVHEFMMLGLRNII